MKKVYDNVVEAIGYTPLVKLNSVTDGLDCNIYVKLEYLNPGGSIKDRIGKYIIEEAEQSGRLKPGGVIVEATSGNTGVGLAMSATLKGYSCIFVVADKQSKEKVDVLRAFGAEVIVTPTAVAPEDPRSYYSVADRLVRETPNAILANQYHNPENPRTHYETTGPELWDQIGDKLTHFVVGLGTGGTVTGTGRYLKEQNPDIQIVGIDPEGSILLDLHAGNEDAEAESYKVEGIGEDFLPTSLDLSVVDSMVRVYDKECFVMARRLVQEESIFTGGSGGAAVVGALKYAREHNLGPDDTLVVILPDGGRSYMGKIFNDVWMRENGYLDRQKRTFVAQDIQSSKDGSDVITVSVNATVEDVVAVMKKYGISQAPVVDDGAHLVGVVREVDLLTHMLSSEHQHTKGESIAAIVNREPLTISADTPMANLLPQVNDDGVAIITDDHKHVLGILTKIDLLHFLSAQVE